MQGFGWGQPKPDRLLLSDISLILDTKQRKNDCRTDHFAATLDCAITSIYQSVTEA